MKKTSLFLMISFAFITFNALAVHFPTKVESTNSKIKETDLEIIIRAIGKDRYDNLLNIGKLGRNIEDSNGYLNYIKPHYFPPHHFIIRGTSNDDREFIAFKWVNVNQPKEVHVETLFQRYISDPGLYSANADIIKPIDIPFNEEELTNFFKGEELCFAGSCYRLCQSQDQNLNDL